MSALLRLLRKTTGRWIRSWKQPRWGRQSFSVNANIYLLQDTALDHSSLELTTSKYQVSKWQVERFIWNPFTTRADGPFWEDESLRWWPRCPLTAIIVATHTLTAAVAAASCPWRLEEFDEKFTNGHSLLEDFARVYPVSYLSSLAKGCAFSEKSGSERKNSENSRAPHEKGLSARSGKYEASDIAFR